MKNTRTLLILSVLIAIVAAASGIVGNIATTVLPDSWKPFLWIAWPVFGLFLLLSIWLLVQQGLAQEEPQRSPEPPQSINLQKADIIYNAPMGTINVYPEGHRQTLSPQPLQLPPPPPDFVGRREEIETLLIGLTSESGIAISGLTGMGGVGKTVLGLKIAHQLKVRYPDAWLFIDLKGTSRNPLSPREVMKFIINSFDLGANLDKLDESELTGLYQSTLSKKKVLLFLDNARDAAQIASLIPPSTCLTLITSRLHFLIPGLHSLQLDVLKAQEAVELLLTICPRIGEDAQTIANLCGYLPIALRLAGGFLQIHSDWSPKDYASRLTDRAKRMSLLKLEGSDIDIEFNFRIKLPTTYRR